jgi:tetratricopeptide (TPR) repeat protein
MMIHACPYRGLDPFSEEDREYFFGREEETTTTAANLITAPMTVLYGASGVGKSSVIMAGVVPFLRRQRNTTVVLFRAWQDRDLLRVLNATVADAVMDQAGIEIDPECGFDICLAAAAARTQTRLTLIFDQFEEFLLYHPAHTASGTTFDLQFARIVNRTDAPVNILISIREDWVAKLDRYQRHIPDLLGNLVRLEHLDAEGAREAITKPLEKFNAERVDRELGPYAIEPELTNVILQQVQAGSMAGHADGGVGRVDGSAGGGPNSTVETPFLQMILTALWNAELQQQSKLMRLATLYKLGGSGKIVSGYVDDVVNHLSDRQQDIAARIFDRLVTPSGNKIAHSPSDLVELTEESPQDVYELLAELEGGPNRLLRKIATPSTERYEIFHDVLAQPILKWRTAYNTRKRERSRARRASAKRRAILFGLVLLLGVLFSMRQWRHMAADARREELHAKVGEKMEDAAKFARSGLPNEAAQKLIAAVHLYEELGDITGLIAVNKLAGDFNTLGLQRVKSEQYEEAVLFFRASALVASKTADKRLRIDSLLQMASCHLFLDQDVEARKATEEIERLTSAYTPSASDWEHLGLLQAALGNRTAAVKALRHASSLAVRANDDVVAARASLTIADMKYNNGEFTEARSFYDDARSHAERSGDYEIEVRSLAQLVKATGNLREFGAMKKYGDQLQVLLSRQPERVRSVLRNNAVDAAEGQ